MIRSFALLALALLAAGCAGNIRPTGYLDDYGKLGETDTRKVFTHLVEEQDDSLDGYYLTREQLRKLEKKGEPVPQAEADGVDLDSAQPVLFVVDKPVWRASTRLKQEDEEKVLFTIRERFYRYLLRQYPHPVRVRYAWVPEDSATEGYRVVTLESAVTDVKKGNGWLRYLVGYGAGTTILQMEGRLLDGTGDTTVISEFAIREDHAGYPNGFFNPTVLSAGYCLRYGAEQAIERLTEEFRDTIPAATPAPHDPVVASRGGE